MSEPNVAPVSICRDIILKSLMSNLRWLQLGKVRKSENANLAITSTFNACVALLLHSTAKDPYSPLYWPVWHGSTTYT